GDCHPLCEGVRLFGPWRGVTPPRGHHVRRTLCTHPDDVGVRGMLLDPPGHAGDQRPVTDRQYDRVDLTGGRQFNTDGACTFGDTRVSAVLHKNSVLLRSGEFAGGIVGAAIGDLVYACAQGSHPGQFHRSDARRYEHFRAQAVPGRRVADGLAEVSRRSTHHAGTRGKFPGQQVHTSSLEATQRVEGFDLDQHPFVERGAKLLVEELWRVEEHRIDQCRGLLDPVEVDVHGRAFRRWV